MEDMEIVRAEALGALAGASPQEPGALRPTWLEGPFNADRLDVGVVTMSPGGVTPPHRHVGGQVIVVMSGRGFVEIDGRRDTLETGDVVIAPPGELHVHGALDEGSFAHLTITTGGYSFPEAPGT
jgi:quercetin dioxygenase-like cupin family protein